MHTLKFARSYLNYSSLSRFTSLISSNDGLAAFCTAVTNHKSSEEPKESKGIFETLATKTEEQKLGSTKPSSFNKPNRSYRRNAVISNIASNRESGTPSKHSHHEEQKDKIQDKVFNETNSDNSSDRSGLHYRKIRSDPEEYYGDESDAMDEMRTPASYGREMYKLIEKDKLGEALTLFKRMCEIDMVKPDHLVYITLIWGCGKKGYTSMAFKLYAEMKEHGMKVENVIYGGLFNSCRNNPFPKTALKQVQQLYETITNQQIALCDQTYHHAITAFSRCGDFEMAFRLVDEMVEKEIVVTTAMFTSILVGCIYDKQSGFLHAIRTWGKMQDKQLRPDLLSYNILFRVTRDCNSGKMESADRMLLDTFKSDLNLESSKLKNNHLLDSKSSNFSLELASQYIMQMPDDLSVQSNTSNAMQLIEPKTPQQRFVLLGGLRNIFTRMFQDEAYPNLATFTYLLRLVPPDNAVDDDLLKIMKYMEVNPDLDFYNVLLKKKNSRRDFRGANVVLSLIEKDNLEPDKETFSVLAMGCSSLRRAQRLLKDLKMAGFRPNIRLMSNLVFQGCYTRQFDYIIEMLEVIKEEEIKPSPNLINQLEKCITITVMDLANRDKEVKHFAFDDGFIQSFESFLKYYKCWLKACKLEMADDQSDSYRMVWERVMGKTPFKP